MDCRNTEIADWGVEMNTESRSATSPSSRTGFVRWFVGGFLLAFVGLLLFYPITDIHPSGQFALRQPLMAYYASAIPRMLDPSTLGPGSSSGSAIFEVAFQHTAVSMVVGMVAGIVGWWRNRKRGQAL
jgi:hypothetical protein